MKYILLFATLVVVCVSNEEITPFKIKIEDSIIQDFKERLSKSRKPDQLKNTTWEYGTNSADLENLIHHWKTNYNWKQREEFLNQFPHFKTKIDDLNIHFIHKKSKSPNSKTIIMLHGWPGSFVECLNVIDSLTGNFFFFQNSFKRIQRRKFQFCLSFTSRFWIQ
jgi:epoxide hydrolase